MGPVKKAFTLAEVLVTLTIIGVVSAMTIPSLKNNVDERTFRSQLLKTYSTIKAAEQAANTDEEPFFDSNVLGLNSYYAENYENIKKYFKLHDIHKSKLGSGGGWVQLGKLYSEERFDVATEVKGLNGQTCLRGDANSYAFRLADGSIVAFMIADNWPWYVYIDVNGPKKPNIVGKDVFLLTSHPNWNWTLMPAGHIRENFLGIKNTCKLNSSGLSCASEIIKNPNFKIPKN